MNTLLREFGAKPFMRIYRMNTGVFLTQETARHVRCGVPGQADLGGILDMSHSSRWGKSSLPSGVRLEIETKTSKGKQRETQKTYQKMIESMGGIYILARTVEDVASRLRGLGFAV